MKRPTELAHLGRGPDRSFGVVNPPVFHASTCLFGSLAELDQAIANPNEGLYYGRRGTPTTWALEEAMAALEPGAEGAKLFPSGVAAIVASFLAFLKPGDHALIVDSAYEPTRLIAGGLLKQLGIAVDFYDPMIGSGIEGLFKDATKLVFCESPGSLTFEVQDLPAIAEKAHARDMIVVLDNTWATPLYFNGYAHGADVVIHALTKYVVGHSDAMLGCASGNARVWPRLLATVHRLGQCAAPDDAYLGLRGLRTLDVRLARHQENALKVARWLEAQALIDRVLHPALEGTPGHDIWKRDFSGASGLFSVVLKAGQRADLAALLDELRFFKLGFSWGGYESLALPARLKGIRTATETELPGPLLRLHIGLEDPEDLIADLAAGLDRYKQALET